MRAPTNWNSYNGNPDSLFKRISFFGFVTRAYSRLLAEADLKGPITVLEFGCGTGFTDNWLCEQYDVTKVTLIDSNEKMLNTAKETLSQATCKKEFVEMDFFDFECGEKYDIVHSQGVIEHFETNDRYRLLKKHCDATKDNGWCIIYFPVPSRSYRFFRGIAELLGVWLFTDEVPLEGSVVEKEMESLGFTVVKRNRFWKLFLTEEGMLFRRKA